MAYIVKTQACLEYRFIKASDRGRLLSVENITRGIGKTSLLVEIARDLDCIIIERDQQTADLFQKKYPDVKFMSPDYERLLSIRKYLLLDEGIPHDLERLIHKRFDVVGGFSGQANLHKCHIEEGVLDNYVYYKENKISY